MSPSKALICRPSWNSNVFPTYDTNVLYSLAQARTGTGKTLAFLIPILQNIITVDPRLEKRSRVGDFGSSTDIRAIIISPTRELAEQIAVEAKKVTRDTGVIVQTAVGGSAKLHGLQKIKREGCHVLVGTPGRLNDILSDPYSQVRAPNLSAFVLDEADRLLDQGFAPEIEAIQRHLPSRSERDRQTLLYSATVPREVMQVVRRTMKPDFQFVRTVQEGEQQTHEKVPQKLVTVAGFENYMPTLVELCKREMAATDSATVSSARPFKAIVYFGATADVALAYSILQNLRRSGQSVFHNYFRGGKIIEMHARLSQTQRTRAADAFRHAQTAIMLSSDVTARGMDFPNVTHVIQIGLPPSQEQYVHRLGRTARGDKTGEGWIILASLEAREIRHRLPDMPLKQDMTLETAKVDMKEAAQLPESTANTLTEVQNATQMVPREVKTASYTAALGVYQFLPNKQVLIDAMNDRAKYGWGMEQPPAINRNLASKLGISRLQGIRIGFLERGIDREDGGGDSDGGKIHPRQAYGRGGSPSFGDHYNQGGDRYDRGGADAYYRGGEWQNRSGGDRYNRGGDRYDRGGGDRYDRRGGYNRSSYDRDQPSRYKRY